MGCHTWFYNKKDPQPSYEECREKLLEHYSIECGYYERHINNTLSNKEKWLFEDKTLDSSKYILSVVNRWKSRVEKSLCKVATLRKSAEVQKLEFCERNHLFYKEVELHDVFRIGGYPDTELLSLAETLNFFEINNDKIFWGYNPSVIGKDKVIERIEKFWIEYPDGLIRFG